MVTRIAHCPPSHSEVKRGPDDAVGVDAVVAVHGFDIATLSELADAQGLTTHTVDVREKCKRVGVPVEHGDHGRGALGGKDLIQNPGGESLKPSALNGPIDQVRAGHADHFDADSHPFEAPGGLDGLGGHGTHGGDAHVGLRRTPQRVRTGQHVATPAFPGRRVVRHP